MFVNQIGDSHFEHGLEMRNKFEDGTVLRLLLDHLGLCHGDYRIFHDSKKRRGVRAVFPVISAGEADGRLQLCLARGKVGDSRAEEKKARRTDCKNHKAKTVNRFFYKVVKHSPVHIAAMGNK